jgi:hypothetical protein
MDGVDLIMIRMEGTMMLFGKDATHRTCEAVEDFSIDSGNV